MIATPQLPAMTIAEYLEWEPLQELRYEYIHSTAIAERRASQGFCGVLIIASSSTEPSSV